MMMGLSALILCNSLRVSITYAYYKIDPMGFIEALCENKDKPEMACNGKCHLMKVSKSQDKDQKTPESIIDFKELLLYYLATSEFVINFDEAVKSKSIFAYKNLYSYNNLEDCFHPPQA